MLANTGTNGSDMAEKRADQLGEPMNASLGSRQDKATTTLRTDRLRANLNLESGFSSRLLMGLPSKRAHTCR